MKKSHKYTHNIEAVMKRTSGLHMVIFLLAGLFLSIAAVADNNGPWTPEQSKTADHTPGTPTSPQGWYPPVETNKPADADSSTTPPPAPAPAPSHYNNGPWTPEQSKTADHTPGTPPSPRGWYPPVDGSPDKPADLTEDLSNFAEKIATSKLANPLIQGGKAIGKTYEAADRGDMTGAAIEATDGIGRLSAIGLGATEGATLGSALGPLGTFIGGVIGGFIGNAGWEYTGGAINESSRQMHQQARQQAEQSRQAAPLRPAGGGSGGCTCR
ncbi:MAG: hypothetical protein JXB18_11680 [Sedimentisphaerales bacterium]|nr:hypothetical protein [Sedimentisphaerales bacterium]